MPHAHRPSVRAPTSPFTGPSDDETLRALRATIELAPVGIAHFAHDGRFLLVNDQLCATLGYSRGELLASTFQEITFPDDLPQCVALTARLAAGEIPSYRHEKRFVRQDSSTVWVCVSVSAVRDAGGRPEFYVAIAEDVTEQRANEAALRDAQESLRLALEASATGTFRWDMRAGTVERDANLDRLFGIASSDDVRSVEQFLALIHPDDRERVAGACLRSARDGVDFDEEYRVDWPDGSTHWLCCKGRTLAGADGAPHHLTGAVTDRTERRRMENELRAQEARFRTLANAIPQMAWVADADGRRSWYNDRWYEFTGLDPAAAHDLGWASVHHPEHRERVRAGQREAFRRGEVWEDTFPLRRRDGVYRWFLSRAMPMRDDAGRAVRWFGTNTDITERLEAERAVRESEAKLRRIADSGIVGVFYWTAGGGISAANDEFCRMLGVSPDDVGRGALDWRTLTPPEWEAVDALKERELAARGFATNWEKEFFAVDGRRVPVLLGAALLDGQTDRGIAVCLDISARKEAEVERERLLARERDARAEAERASRARDELLAVVAHDLRNPVHTIMMSVATMTELPLDEEQRLRQLGVVRRAARGMDTLIRDLLDVTRIESGTFAIRQARVHVRALLDETLELFDAHARERAVSLACDVPPDVPPVLGDRDRLAQLLSNLVGNALKFTPRGGAIRLSARRVGDRVEVSVEDSGMGIPAESLPHVFDRFWQADRRSHAGAGLGLAIVKGIVEAHGGAVAVESEPGRGTTFRCTLPCA